MSELFYWGSGMKKILIGLILLLFGFIGNAFGASVYSCTQTVQGSGPYKVYKMVWVSANPAGWTATATTYDINGVVLLVEFVPSSTAAPTNLYDITLRNSNGIDVLGDTGAAGSENYDGAGANLSSSVPSETQPLLNGNYGAVPVYGPLTLYIYNMGAAKGGTVYIHYLTINE